MRGNSVVVIVSASIIGHNGEFGEHCRAVATQIVNYIDIFDSNVTGIEQSMAELVL